MTRVIAIGDGPVIAEPANDLQLRQLVTAAASAGDLSITSVQLAGRHRRLQTTRSTRVYVVLTGSITMQIGDDEPERVDAGELLVVPRGVAYELAGTGTYLVINAPAFVEGDDDYLDYPDRTEPAR
jgi:mannose-6-phosphate isomerase-like protein (cupin superfamily)